MGLSGRPHVAEMLDEQKQILDQIFGSGVYKIEKTSEFSAILKTPYAGFCISDDPRDFVAASVVSVPGMDVVKSPIDTWMQFLGEETPPQKRTDPYEEQLANELKWIAAVVDRILKHPDRTRDAAWFIAGYNRAYNDWASRKGSWTEPNFKG